MKNEIKMRIRRRPVRSESVRRGAGRTQAWASPWVKKGFASGARPLSRNRRSAACGTLPYGANAMPKNENPQVVRLRAVTE
jgi:hypothetical protein